MEGWDYPGWDLDWDFEEMLKVGVQTKFSPKLQQPGREQSAERWEKSLRYRKFLSASLSSLQRKMDKSLECVCVGAFLCVCFDIGAALCRSFQTGTVNIWWVLYLHRMNTYVVIKAIICAQLDILLVPLVRIPMLIRAIRSTSTNSLVCVHFEIFHRPIMPSS